MRHCFFSLALAFTVFAQSNTYFGPKQRTPGDRVRIQVDVQDSLELGGVSIEKASFNGQSIPLKPRDVNGYRGSASFQLAPGKYLLRWTVHRDKFAWPRFVDHEEVVNIDPKDLWIQIQIVGDDASIR